MPVPIPQLLPEVYDQLRALADAHLRHERAGHTLQATALAHEAYAKLAARPGAVVNDERHFLALAAQAIRRVLVDHARAKSRAKRGGAALREASDALDTVAAPDTTDVVALDDALEALAASNPRQAQVVELKYFGGLTAEQAADILGVTSRTVENDWAFARAWLRDHLRGR
ncbi:MAG: sigma-70 family RNA polymerase sigma factor [Phycisphaerae bacterium]|nr:sigma-70 family RNA polymerase sigma factor [Phycisphaerae bacterium]